MSEEGIATHPRCAPVEITPEARRAGRHALMYVSSRELLMACRSLRDLTTEQLAAVDRIYSAAVKIARVAAKRSTQKVK